MDYIVNTLLALMPMLLIAFVYFMFRNDWIYKSMIEILDYECAENFEAIESLPSYGRMLYRYFWIWDFEKLRNKK